MCCGFLYSSLINQLRCITTSLTYLLLIFATQSLLPNMKVSMATLLASCFFTDCVIPENIYTPPIEGILVWTELTPTPLDIIFPVLLHTFLLKLWLSDTRYPQNFQ